MNNYFTLLLRYGNKLHLITLLLKKKFLL
uniref:Uncharacterized protein n=1 Tax=Rhizophora mucronata TaxID=61149 RepID=A0A2P2P3Q5_RHIMU